MVDIIAKNVDRKGGQELNKVDRKVEKKRKKADRKFRMTPKMTQKNKE